MTARVPVSKGAKFTVFQDSAGEWRWNLKGGNGEIVAVSSEGYSRSHDAVRSIAAVRRLVPLAPTKKEIP